MNFFERQVKEPPDAGIVSHSEVAFVSRGKWDVEINSDEYGFPYKVLRL